MPIMQGSGDADRERRSNHSTPSSMAGGAVREASADIRHDDARSPDVPAPLLDIANLRLDIPTSQGVAHILRGVSLRVAEGETLGIVGESGSGKSMLLRAALGLIPSNSILSGKITFEGDDLLTMRPTHRRYLLGKSVGVVFQNPTTSLNPVIPIGRQMGEASIKHLGLSRRRARERALDLLKQVGIPNASKRLDDFPHQFSGGMCQRVMIAMALTCEPKLLVADEATTALDVTVQKEILDLLERVQASHGMAMILVSHDLSVVSKRTDRVAVMYGGRLVTSTDTEALFNRAPHPYVEALLKAIPRLDAPAHSRLSYMTGLPPSVYDDLEGIEADNRDLLRWNSVNEAGGDDAPRAPRVGGDVAATVTTRTDKPHEIHFRRGALLTVEGLECSFKTTAGRVQAVRGVSFDVLPGETLGLVGESGCGKTTTGRAILQLPPGQEGSVTFDGDDLTRMNPRQLRAIRSKIQMIFQNPLASFNARRRVMDVVGEGLAIQGKPREEIRRRVAEALEQVRMDISAIGDRRPGEFSGGQCQRLAIARALAVEPRLIVCDEPVASLDVSVQARVLDVLEDVRARNNLSLVFISHDLGVVRNVSDRIAVMYRGKIVEIGNADSVYSAPAHPYTHRLLNAIPVVDDDERPQGWSGPSRDFDWETSDYPLVAVGDDHFAALPEDLVTRV